jgi:histone H3/H4
MNILNSKSIDKGNSPKDITIIRKIFDSLGIEEYEKNTLNYMSEFINSYIIDILKEAKKNMNLAKREKINIEDVEAAVSTKQKDMYRNRTTIKEMKSLANKINTVELPKIPENDIFLRPPKDINLLGNNFQIYSTELNQLILDNKTMLENTSLRPDEINLLGNKRKVNFANESKNTLNLDHNGKQIKNKRKISLNQAFKKTSQENAKKENNNLIENNTNIKINFSEPKKLVDVKSNNIGLNLDEDNEDDNDNDEGENTNMNNIGESTMNKKEEEDEGDEEVEGEEYEEENEDNEFNNESESKKDKKNGELNLFHEGDNNDEEDFDD